MNCEIIAIGTELLLGQIIDTNSATLAQALTYIGIDCHYQTRVGDNLSRIKEALLLALSRSNVVITCGGLGPTQDDITRYAIAEVTGVPLQRDPALLARIAAIFDERQRPFLPINHVQADLPKGATPMTALPGTAPGFIMPACSGTKVIYAVPGVPSELSAMLAADILPHLKKRLARREKTIRSHTLYCFGIGESAIAEILAPQFEALEKNGNPTMAFLASDKIGVRVRLTAKAKNHDEARQLLAHEAQKIRPLLSRFCYAETQEETEPLTPEQVLFDRLKKNGKTLCCAESLTGGLIGERFSALTGASHVFRGGLTAYAANVKFDLLKVPRGNVVSESAARSMAEHARQLFQADYSVAATGVAGPDTQEDVPVGTVYLAVASEQETRAATFHFGARGRHVIRELSATAAFQMLLDLTKR